MKANHGAEARVAGKVFGDRAAESTGSMPDTAGFSLESALEDISEAITGKPFGFGSLESGDEGEGRYRASERGASRVRPGRGGAGMDFEGLVRTARSECPDLAGDRVFDWLDGFLASRLRESGIQHRAVKLEGAWYRDGAGPLIAIGEDGAICLLEPGLCGYRCRDAGSGRKRRVGRKGARAFGEKAFCFYRPFPDAPLTLRDILTSMIGGISASDALLICLMLSASTLLGMLLPQANQMLFGPVLSSHQASFLPYACVLLFGVVAAQALLNAMKTMVLSGVGRKLALEVESAAMMRLLSLPATFFKERSAGELANLMATFSSVAVMLQTALLGTVVSAVFSLAYLVQIFAISPALGVPALIAVAANSAVCLLSMALQTRLEKRKTLLRAKLGGWQASLLQNVRTIRLAASEKRAFATWAKRYAAVLRVEYNGPLSIRLVPCVQLAIVLVCTIAVYSGAVGAQVPASRFMAFNCAFGMLMGVHLGLSQAAGALAKARSQLAVLAPFTCQLPEKGACSGEDHDPSGDIELKGLRFSYPGGGREVLSGLDLHIHPGEFRAVVGESGCGKSTLVRLLLGFERAGGGSVLFDGKDIGDLDLHALRRRFGVVLQDAQLFKGDILSNIIVSAPWLSEDEAWKAAEAAGIAGDIASLPMGMHTIVPEGGAGFSGGQRQRIAIARAIAAHPKVILFDEATSALDNITQSLVMDSLKEMDCTRIVIAHRLSTVRECDRIVVLKGGRIVEEGSFDDLMEKGREFCRLASRQL